jgi:hypothetical protein
MGSFRWEHYEDWEEIWVHVVWDGNWNVVFGVGNGDSGKSGGRDVI